VSSCTSVAVLYIPLTPNTRRHPSPSLPLIEEAKVWNLVIVSQRSTHLPFTPLPYTSLRPDNARRRTSEEGTRLPPPHTTHTPHTPGLLASWQSSRGTPCRVRRGRGGQGRGRGRGQGSRTLPTRTCTRTHSHTHPQHVRYVDSCASCLPACPPLLSLSDLPAPIVCFHPRSRLHHLYLPRPSPCTRPPADTGTCIPAARSQCTPPSSPPLTSLLYPLVDCKFRKLPQIVTPHGRPQQILYTYLVSPVHPSIHQAHSSVRPTSASP